MARSSSCALLTVVVTVALVALLGVGVHAAPPFTCTYTSSSDGSHYDLSNVYRDPGMGQQDYSYTASDNSKYYVNVCGQAAETACNPPNGVCQVAESGAGYGDGDASNAKWENLSGAQGVKITITDGSGGNCNTIPRTSYLQIKCDQTVTTADAVIDSITESQTVLCQYTVAMRSRWACPTGGTTPPPPPGGPPPPPGPPPAKNKGGLSIGSIILITIACVIPVYLVVGGLIKWKVYEAEPLSLDIIPNVGLWSALPFLVKDGCVYFFNKVSGGRICSNAEYSTV